MRQRALPITPPLAGRVARACGRACLRVWLTYRLDSYKRNLHAIAAQRQNDFHAERLLHRAISATRARLQSL